MTTAERILFELAQSLESTVDGPSIPYLIGKSKSPAYASEQQTSGDDRAQRAVDLLVDDLNDPVPGFQRIQPAILRIIISPDFPLLMRELLAITEGLRDVVGQEPGRFMVHQVTNPLIEDLCNEGVDY